MEHILIRRIYKRSGVSDYYTLDGKVKFVNFSSLLTYYADNYSQFKVKGISTLYLRYAVVKLISHKYVITLTNYF